MTATQDFLPPLGDQYESEYKLTEVFDDWSGELLGYRFGHKKTETDGPQLRRPPPRDIDSDEIIKGLLQAGHGYQVTAADRNYHKPIQTLCRYCHNPLPLPRAGNWFCEFEEPFQDCECNACLIRCLWLAREFRGRGRPRIQCGSRECIKAHNAERKRRSRSEAT